VRGLDLRLQELAQDAGFDAFGITAAQDFLPERQAIIDNREQGLNADMRFVYGDPVRATSPQHLVPDAASIISVARRYIMEAPDVEHGRPNVGQVARYAWTDPYRELKASLRPLTRLLKQNGYRARVLADDNVLVDRAAAVRAGLGWFGRNSTVILHGQGSWFVLANIVTSAQLPSSAQPSKSSQAPGVGCGTCEACIPACPTGALDGSGRLDARRCLSWLLQSKELFPDEFRVALGGRVYGCDECQVVCPPNNVALRLKPALGAPSDVLASVDLVEALTFADEQLLARFDHWYIADRDPVWLRRNFLLALGNVGDVNDDRVSATIARYLDAEHDAVADAARWAGSRIAARRADLDLN
jgi:epoxyqueuosine reductase